MADPELPVSCVDEERRRDVAEPTSTFNGIDWVEVDPADQKILHVGFLHPLPGQGGGIPASPPLGVANVAVSGGERITGVRTRTVTAAGNVLTVTVDRAGDFSPYLLRLVRSTVDHRAPAGFDPVLSAQRFSFKANCPSPLDCKPDDGEAPPADPPGPPIDYLAKDYAGFRRLMLDRLATLLPGWTERSPADPLVTVVEALAHAADRLSYRQDAVGTEPYLTTARSRVSVRRHARLLDYPVHDGCTARTWLRVEVLPGSPVVTDGIARGTPVLSAGPDRPTVPPGEVERMVAAGAVAFETLDALAPRAERNRIELYAWGGRSCALPAGSIRATLVDQPATGLEAGDLLLLEETAGAQTGRAGDADPAHRQVVRLVKVSTDVDPVTSVPLLEVEWGLADALRFPLQLTTVVPGAGTGTVVTCAVARGNVVAAHHARMVTGELPPAQAQRWRPVLTDAPVACATPAPLTGPAAGALVQDPRAALPLVRLDAPDGSWQPRADLLGVSRFDRGFVVERERDGRSALRFGDDVLGQRPPAGTRFHATWWVGGTAAGNVGHDVLTCLATGTAGVVRVTNPVPATGGTDPEELEYVRQHAPAAFLTQERAVTTVDWAEVARRLPEVQDAAARIRWTGSWWTVFLTLDLIGGRRLAAEPPLAARLRASLDRFRIAGYDLELRDPVDVPVDLTLWVCVARGSFRATVRRALQRVFDRRPGGFFHPDRFSFGQPLYASQLVAAAVAVPGVAQVRVTELHPTGVAQGTELTDGVLPVGDLQVIRLDNDPSAPEHGVLRLDLAGGL
jgi:Baseplate J-like protein